MATNPIWYVRAVGADGATLSAHMSGRYADGSVVDAAEIDPRDVAAAEATWRATFDPATGQLLTVDPGAGPSMWFVEDRPSDADPPDMCLIAFPTHHFPPGMVVSNDEFEGMPVASGDQIGAVKWWPGTGRIHELYVQPERRRQRIGYALTQAAAADQIAGGRPPCWGGGDLTDLGEAFVQTLPIQQRITPRIRSVAPMTPDDRREGIPERNLFPDSQLHPDS